MKKNLLKRSMDQTNPYLLSFTPAFLPHPSTAAVHHRQAGSRPSHPDLREPSRGRGRQAGDAPSRRQAGGSGSGSCGRREPNPAGCQAWNSGGGSRVLQAVQAQDSGGSTRRAAVAGSCGATPRSSCEWKCVRRARSRLGSTVMSAAAPNFSRLDHDFALGSRSAAAGVDPARG